MNSSHVTITVILAFNFVGIVQVPVKDFIGYGMV